MLRLFPIFTFITAFTGIVLCGNVKAETNSKDIAATKPPSTTTPTKTNRPMKSITLKPTEATHGPLTLKITGAVEPNDGLTDLRLTIRLRNNSAAAVALMNGGTTQEPKRGVFFVEADEAGVVTLVQKAYALPDPTPTVPVIPAATVLAPASSVESVWQATLETVGLQKPYMGFPNAGATPPMPRLISKMRVCIAYKNFSEGAFESIKGHKGFFMPIGAIEKEQSMICSPLIDLP
jgi:hypothetical protein